jgi:peptidoglycan/LPS O-acetylase OafA/YrhL
MIENSTYVTRVASPIQVVKQGTVKMHLGTLDLLRGLAALSVVLYHFCLPGRHGGFLVKFYSPTLHHLFSWGNLGVEAFFAISGFIIPFSLWSSAYKLGDFGRYMRKRIVRIVPPAYVLIVLILLQWAIVDGLHHNTERLSSVSITQVVSNVLFIVPFTHTQWFNGVFWTLGVEFQYYLVLGALFNLCFKEGQFPVFVLVNLLLFGASYLPNIPHETYLLFTPLFAAGGTTLLYYKGWLTKPVYLATIALWAALSWLALGALATAFGIGTAGLIAFVRVNNPVFAFFGKISYSLYLTHFLVGSTAEFVLSKVFPSPSEITSILVIVMLTGVSIGFAYLFYRWIESPFLALAQRMKV